MSRLVSSRSRFRRALLFAGAALLLTPTPLVQAAAAPAKSKGDLDVKLDVQEFTLDNGLRVYVVEDHSTPVFSLRLAYDVGSRDEVKGRTGFAHFFEHMMFMGSKNMARAAIAENTSKNGGNVNAFTNADTTVYLHDIPSQYLDMVLWGEADRLGGLEITEEAFEVQRAAVKSEKERAENSPFWPVFETLMKTVFDGTPYSHMTIGSLEDLNAAEVADVRAFFDTYYRPNNAVLVLAGDVKFDEVKAKVDQYFGEIPKGDPKPPTPESNVVRGKKSEMVIEDGRTQQTQYIFAWPTVGEAHDDRWAIDMLGQILMGGSSSRITRRLTDEMELVSGAFGGHFLLQRDAGAMGLIAVPTEKQELEKIKEVIAEELALVAKKGVSKKELQKAINQQLVSTVGELSTNSGRATSVATGALFHNDPKWALTILDRYSKVTNADIKRVATNYLNENWAFIELKPE